MHGWNAPGWNGLTKRGGHPLGGCPLGSDCFGYWSVPQITSLFPGAVGVLSGGFPLGGGDRPVPTGSTGRRNQGCRCCGRTGCSTSLSRGHDRVFMTTPVCPTFISMVLSCTQKFRNWILQRPSVEWLRVEWIPAIPSLLFRTTLPNTSTLGEFITRIPAPSTQALATKPVTDHRVITDHRITRHLMLDPRPGVVLHPVTLIERHSGCCHRSTNPDPGCHANSCSAPPDS